MRNDLVAEDGSTTLGRGEAVEEAVLGAFRLVIFTLWIGHEENLSMGSAVCSARSRGLFARAAQGGEARGTVLGTDDDAEQTGPKAASSRAASARKRPVPSSGTGL